MLDDDSPDYTTAPHERLADRYEALLDRVAGALQMLEQYRAGTLDHPGLFIESLQEVLDGPDTRDRLGNGVCCRGCGCSENDPCPEGCAWHDDDLCTQCAEFAAQLVDQVFGRGLEARLTPEERQHRKAEAWAKLDELSKGVDFSRWDKS
jgi:hypothetical protein